MPKPCFLASRLDYRSRGHNTCTGKHHFEARRFNVWWFDGSTMRSVSNEARRFNVWWFDGSTMRSVSKSIRGMSEISLPPSIGNYYSHNSERLFVHNSVCSQFSESLFAVVMLSEVLSTRWPDVLGQGCPRWPQGCCEQFRPYRESSLQSSLTSGATIVPQNRAAPNSAGEPWHFRCWGRCSGLGDCALAIDLFEHIEECWG